MIDSIRPSAVPAVGTGISPELNRGSAGGVAGAFADVLRDTQAPGVQISRHAAKRLEERGISLEGDQRDRLNQAMASLAGKGGRTSLVMLQGVAYVVDVPSQTVVTAVKADSGKESIFTQIDSVVVA